MNCLMNAIKKNREVTKSNEDKIQNDTISLIKQNQHPTMEQYQEVINEKNNLNTKLENFYKLLPSINENQKLLEEAVSTAINFQDKVKLQQARVKNQEDDMKDMRVHWDSEREELKFELNRLNEELLKKDKKIQELQNQNEEIEKAHKELNTKKDLSIQYLNTQNKDLEESLKLKTEQLITTSECLSDSQEELANKQNEFEKAESKAKRLIIENNEKLNFYMDEYFRLNCDLQTILHECLQKTSSKTIIYDRDQLAKELYDSQIEAMRQTICELNNYISGITVNEEITRLDDENKELRNKINELKHDINGQKELLGTVKANLRYYKDRNNEQASIINKHANNENDFKKKNSLNRLSIEKLVEEKRILKEQCSKYEQTLKNLTEERNRARDDRSVAMSFLGTDSSQLVEKIQIQNKNLQIAGEDIEKLDSLVEYIREVLKAHKQEISNYKELTTLLEDIENPSKLSWLSNNTLATQ